MKIRSKSHKKRIAIITSLLVVIVLGAGTTFAAANRVGPFAPANVSNSDTSSSDSTSADSTENSSPTNAAENHDNSSAPSDDENQSDSKSSGNSDNYVDTPIANPPKSNASYPIENSHYKIEQNSAKSFHVTLYPIANNPDYSDYTAQEKAYKNEALSYLKKRYGSVDNLNINWTPTNAKNL